MSAEEDRWGQESSRVHCGFVTISGSSDTGLRVTLPKGTALGEGFRPGDVCPVKYDSVREEFVILKPDDGGE